MYRKWKALVNAMHSFLFRLVDYIAILIWYPAFLCPLIHVPFGIIALLRNFIFYAF